MPDSRGVSDPPCSPAAIRRAIAQYEGMAGAEPRPLGRGLIHQTFELRAPAGRYVLQRVNPIFDPRIHHNIWAVTARLGEAGLTTPRLLESRQGRPWAEPGDGTVWRVMTFIEGVSFDVVADPEQTRAAARLVGRFHRALDGLEHRFVGLRPAVHDPSRHLAALGQSLVDHAAHPLFGEVARLGKALLEQAERLPPLADLPPRVCHGDLKLNNVLFAGPEPPERERAVCLVDLDTLAPMALAHELGDAWRSWCNPAGENAAETRFNLAIFEASWQGYLEGAARTPSRAERRALLGGVEWISLELAARFAADALCECYFGWDRERFERAGEHNLLRARGQWRLHQAAVALRSERARLLEL